MSKPPLSVSFHNFHDEFDPGQNFFTDALSRRYRVEVDPAGRDLQISGVFGHRQLPEVGDRRPLRVWVSGEAREPTAQIFDLHFGFAPQNILGERRWHRFPLWVFYIHWFDPNGPSTPERLVAPRKRTERSRFCNFIYSNDVSIRAEFYFRLSRQRPVDSLGPVLNNSGRQLPGGALGKLAALRDYRFTIAFENQIAPGYVTEKLLEPLSAGSIPIYWGAHEALDDFNPDAFVFAPDFPDLESLVEHVIALDADADRVAAMQSAPIFKEGRIPYHHTPDFFFDRVEEALASDFRAEVPDSWKGPFVAGKREPKYRKRWRELKRAAQKARIWLRSRS